MLAAKGEGNAVKKKKDTHKMAESNKAFAHLLGNTYLKRKALWITGLFFFAQ